MSANGANQRWSQSIALMRAARVLLVIMMLAVLIVPGTTRAAAAPDGNLVVKVADPAGNAVAGASVSLSGGTVGALAGKFFTTGADGTYTFLKVPAGLYTVSADYGGQTGTAAISMQGVAGAAVTVTLGDPAGAPGSATGGLTGRICAPKAPGADIFARGPNGEAEKVSIAADGRLGAWRTFTFQNLAAGEWTVTLATPGLEPVSRKVTVRAGTVVTTSDFTLACTGEPGPAPLTPPAGWLFYLGGGLLILTGLLLRIRLQPRSR